MLVPVFIYAFISLIFLMRVLDYQEQVLEAMDCLAEESSIAMATTGNKLLISPVSMTAKVNLSLDSKLKVSMLRSNVDEESKRIELNADYIVPLPCSLFGFSYLPCSEKMVTRGFCGVKRRGIQKDNTTVFVTETGSVYHKDQSCTYLKIHVTQVQFSDIPGFRNENGGIYKACKKCCSSINLSEQSKVYIANYGERYHTTKSCKAIKRTVKTIMFSEVGNRLPCSKCGS